MQKHRVRPIFRADAVQRYIQGRERPVLPRFISPRTFICLWLLLGLLSAAGLLAWLTRVPVYASGSAVVAEWGDGGHNIAVVAFLPPDDLPLLRVGQTVFLKSGIAGERLSRSILAVEPEIISPGEAKKRFGFAASQPAAVAIARMEPIPAGLPASSYIGSVYRVDVEVGVRRVASLLPVVGQLYGG